MTWLQCILYGFVMGISEFIPVSSSAQSRILQQLFGITANDSLCNLIVHICSIAALLIAWKRPLDFLLPTPNMPRRSSHGYHHSSGDIDSKFVRAAIVPMLLIMLLSLYLFQKVSTIVFVFHLLVNGILLYLPERMLQGNKSARGMSGVDAWMIGAAGALSVIPGYSRIGLLISAAQMRGADRKHALNWAYMLSIPALLLLIVADLAGIMFGGNALSISTGILGYLLLGIFSFGGSYLAVYFIRNLIIHRGLCAYAYYSWGSALFAFILYLL